MKLIIAGSRTGIRSWHVDNFIRHVFDGWKITEIVSGGAKGADTLGETWAKNHNIPVTQFIPDWDTHGKFAGIKRNIDMAAYADACVVFWNGESRGSKSMITEALAYGIKLYVWTL